MGTPFNDPNRRVNGEYELDEMFGETITLVERLAAAGYSGVVGALDYRPLRNGETPGIPHQVRLYRPIYSNAYDHGDFPVSESAFRIGKADFPSYDAGDLSGAMFIVTSGPAAGLVGMADSSGLVSINGSDEEDPAGLYWRLAIDASYPLTDISSSDYVDICEEMTEVTTEPETDAQFRCDYIDGWVQVTDDYSAADTLYAWYYKASQILRDEHFINSSAGASDAAKVVVTNADGEVSDTFIGDTHTGDWDVSGDATVGGSLGVSEDISADIDISAGRDVSAGRNIAAGGDIGAAGNIGADGTGMFSSGIHVPTNSDVSTFGLLQQIELIFDGTNFYIKNKTGGTAKIILDNVNPRANATYSLGQSGTAWLSAYINTLIAATKVQTAQVELGSGGPQILGGNSDPTSGSGVAAPVGSLYQRDSTGGGRLYIKFDTGDTDWYQIHRGITGAMYEMSSSYDIPTSAGSAAIGVIVYDAKIADEPGSDRYNQTSGKFTFGRAGIYFVNASVRIVPDSTWGGGTEFGLIICKNGTAYKRIGAASVTGASSDEFTISGSAMVYASSGSDYIEIRLMDGINNSDITDSCNVDGSSHRECCYLSIQEVPTP